MLEMCVFHGFNIKPCGKQSNRLCDSFYIVIPQNAVIAFLSSFLYKKKLGTKKAPFRVLHLTRFVWHIQVRLMNQCTQFIGAFTPLSSQ